MGRPRGNARIADAAFGMLLAVAGIVVWSWLVRTVVMPPLVQAIGAFLVVWVPLGVFAWTGRRRTGAGMPGAPDATAGSRAGERGGVPRFAFRPIDLLWGAGVGLLLRGLAAAIEFGATGRAPGGGASLEPDPATAWLVLVVAPIIVAPVVEEWFFRGLVLPAVRDSAVASGARPTTAAVLAVATSALLFGLLHTLDAASPTMALVTGASAFVFGAAAGALVVFTNRLGGAIIAHAVFNGSLVLLLVA